MEQLDEGAMPFGDLRCGSRTAKFDVPCTRSHLPDTHTLPHSHSVRGNVDFQLKPINPRSCQAKQQTSLSLQAFLSLARFALGAPTRLPKVSLRSEYIAYKQLVVMHFY